MGLAGSSSSVNPDTVVGGGSCPTTLYPGQSLSGGSELCSGNGYRLVMQTDGNLVEYNSSGVALWATDTDNEPGNYVVMQTDGNLVIYSPSGTAMWASGTWGIGEGTAYLTLQTDSNLVIYDNVDAIWARMDFSAQAYAQETLFQHGWGSSQWTYLYDLWEDESNWEWYVCYGGGTYPNCNYAGSAYGIPQADPGAKMGPGYEYGSWPDWTTDPFTQVGWGMGYIARNFGTPQAAWDFATNNGTCPIGSDGLPTECAGGYVLKGVS